MLFIKDHSIVSKALGKSRIIKQTLLFKLTIFYGVINHPCIPTNESVRNETSLSSFTIDDRVSFDLIAMMASSS